MNFLLKSKPKHESRLKLFSIAALFCLLILITIFFSGVFRSLFYEIGKPIWSVKTIVTDAFNNIGNYFVSKNKLSNENLSLQDQISSLELKVIDYDVLQKQNEELKSILGRGVISDKMVSRVLSKPPVTLYDTIIIDVGSDDGLVQGAKVYMSDDVIMGFIKEITPKKSLVSMFSSGGQLQEAVNSRTGETFEIVGMGGTNFRLEVPKDADIIWGDVFEYPSITSSTIGSVYYIDTNSQSSFKTIYIRIPGNAFDSKWVLVEKLKQ